MAGVDGGLATAGGTAETVPGEPVVAGIMLPEPSPAPEEMFRDEVEPRVHLEGFVTVHDVGSRAPEWRICGSRIATCGLDAFDNAGSPVMVQLCGVTLDESAGSVCQRDSSLLACCSPCCVSWIACATSVHACCGVPGSFRLVIDDVSCGGVKCGWPCLCSNTCGNCDLSQTTGIPSTQESLSCGACCLVFAACCLLTTQKASTGAPIATAGAAAGVAGAAKRAATDA